MGTKLHRVTVIGGMLLAAASSVACGLRSFRPPEGSPEPAAAQAKNQRPDAPQLPFGLARDDDFVVRVVAGAQTCSGTLIEEDQVLTAHHCVAERSSDGDFTSRVLSAKGLSVELGGDDLPWGQVGVKAVLTPPCGHAAGDGDIAILVLERKLIGVATAKPRLDQPPAMGEAVSPVGFGRCAASSESIHRRQRTGGRIDKMMDLRFRLDASICPGDSGGPVVSGSRGDIVGVISAAVMDGSEQTLGRAEFTRLDRWRSVFAAAKLVSEGTSLSEVPPIAGCPGN